MTWREAARGIPVWAGAFFFEDQTREWPIRRMCTDVTEPPTYPKRSTWAAPAEYDSSRCYPDLTDPDTRTAYLRRLAVALGCPEEVADEGVRFRHLGGSAWTLTGGDPQGNGPTFRADFLSSPTRIEALALAWPANKRVTT